MTVNPQHIRMIEALLFAAEEPLDEGSLQARLPDDVDLPETLAALGEHYKGRGIELVQLAGRWTFRTASDLAQLLEEHKQVTRRLSRAAVETLAIIAYHQPITRAEIEEVRGVSISRGTLDVLMEAGWVKLKGRRRTPGRPVTFGTTDEFLIHFGLNGIDELPGVDELKSAGLLSANPPPGFMPVANDEERDEDDEDEDEDDGDPFFEAEADEADDAADAIAQDNRPADSSDIDIPAIPHPPKNTAL